MPERSDKWEDLTPHHRKPLTDAESAYQEYLKENRGKTPKEAFIAGWEAYKSRTDKMYSIEEVKEIFN